MDYDIKGIDTSSASSKSDTGSARKSDLKKLNYCIGIHRCIFFNINFSKNAALYYSRSE
jgi:hypothetical protein